MTSHDLTQNVIDFINCGDLLECRELAANAELDLLNPAADEICDALAAQHAEDQQLAASIATKRELLRRCRAYGVNVAFATAFTEIYPDPKPEVVAAFAKAATSEQDMLRLTETHPEWLADMQIITARLRLLAMLIEDLGVTTDTTLRANIGRVALPLTDRNLDPMLWAQMRGELANALAAAGGAEEEAIALYREILPVVKGTELESQTELGITLLLAKTDPGTAIPQLERAIEEGYKTMGPEKLIALQDALEEACARAASDESNAAERFTPVLPDGWSRASGKAVPAMSLEEWLPQADRFPLWRELVTVIRRTNAQRMPFAGLLARRERELPKQLVNGTFELRVLSSSKDELTYGWSARDDFAVQDQAEIVRLLRGSDALHEIHFAFRGRGHEEIHAWMERLMQATLTVRPCDDSAPPLPPDEVERVLTELRTPLSEEPADPEQYFRDAMARLPLMNDPFLLMTAGTLAALQLLGVASRSDKSIDTAIGAFRRACEIFPRDSQASMWALNAKNIAHACLLRQGERRAESLAQAQIGFEAAARVFIELGDKPQLADAIKGLGLARCNATEKAEEKLATIPLFEQAIELLDRDTQPVQWSETMIALGDVYANADDDHSAEADRAWSAVLEQFAANPAFRSVGTETMIQLTAMPVMRIRSLDRRGWVPPDPTHDDRKKPPALYLRPLDSAAALTLPNRFVDPASLDIQYDREPESLPVESVLYRILGRHLLFISLGGRPEGLGLTRIYLIGGTGWQEAVEDELDRNDIIFLMPHASAGVKWEIETIIRKQVLPRCLFIMPPHSPEFDVETMWREAEPMMREMNLALPPFDAEGMFFRFTDAGNVRDTIPFSTVWNDTLFARIEPMVKEAGALKKPASHPAPRQ